MVARSARDSDDRDPPRGWVSWVSTFATGLAVVGVVIAAAVLQVEAPPTPVTVALDATEGDRDASPGGDEGRGLRPTRDIAAGGPGAAPDARDRLEARARTDHGRLIRSGQEWTVQWLLSCDPENASRWFDTATAIDAQALYVLPFDRQGEACYRFCWGAFGDRAAADRAIESDTFERLGLSDTAMAKEILEVTP